MLLGFTDANRLRLRGKAKGLQQGLQLFLQLGEHGYYLLPSKGKSQRLIYQIRPDKADFNQAPSNYRALASIREDVDHLAPWLSLAPPPPGMETELAGERALLGAAEKAVADLADAFIGHRLCDPEPYQWGRDGEIPFHPNAAGHAALAARLSAVLDALVTEGAAAHR